MNATTAVAVALAALAFTLACGPLPADRARDHRRDRADRSHALDLPAADDAPPTADESAPPASPPPSSPPPSSPPSSTPPPAEPAPERAAWTVVVDRELPYFACTGGGPDFQLVMSATDAVVVLADNTNVPGTVLLADAVAGTRFSIPGYLTSTVSDGAVLEDMLVSFTAGATTCTALAYALHDGFDAVYADAKSDVIPGALIETWDIAFGALGQLAATETDEYEEAAGGTTEYIDHFGVYFIDGTTVHGAFIDDGTTFSGTVEPDHTIFTLSDGVWIPR